MNTYVDIDYYLHDNNKVTFLQSIKGETSRGDKKALNKDDNPRSLADYLIPIMVVKTTLVIVIPEKFSNYMHLPEETQRSLFKSGFATLQTQLVDLDADIIYLVDENNLLVNDMVFERGLTIPYKVKEVGYLFMSLVFSVIDAPSTDISARLNVVDAIIVDFFQVSPHLKISFSDNGINVDVGEDKALSRFVFYIEFEETTSTVTLQNGKTNAFYQLDVANGSLHPLSSLLSTTLQCKKAAKKTAGSSRLIQDLRLFLSENRRLIEIVDICTVEEMFAAKYQESPFVKICLDEVSKFRYTVQSVRARIVELLHASNLVSSTNSFHLTRAHTCPQVHDSMASSDVFGCDLTEFN